MRPILHLGVKTFGESERRGEEQSQPEEAGGELPQHLGDRSDGEAEEEQRGGAEDEDGHELRAAAPLQEQLFAEGGDQHGCHLRHRASVPQQDRAQCDPAACGQTLSSVRWRLQSVLTPAPPPPSPATPPARFEQDALVGRGGGALELVRGDDDRRPARLQLAHDVIDEHESLGIELAVRLVEQRDARLLQQHARERQPLAHAGGEGGDGVVGAAAEGDAVEQRVDAGARAAEVIGDDGQVLARGQRIVEIRGMAEQRDELADVLALA